MTNQEQIDLYEFKAKWCDAHGFTADAQAHRAYVAQLKKKEAALHAADIAKVHALFRPEDMPGENKNNPLFPPYL